MFRLTLHGDVAAEGIRALEDSQPEIHELTLWNPACEIVHEYLREPAAFHTQGVCNLTGKSLPTYPLVTQLALIECHLVTGVGIQHIIRKALPALEVMSTHNITVCLGCACGVELAICSALWGEPEVH